MKGQAPFIVTLTAEYDLNEEDGEEGFESEEEDKTNADSDIEINSRKRKVESSTDSDDDYEEFMGVYSSREAAIKNAKVVIQTDSRNRRQFEHCNRHERLGWGGCVPIGEIVRTSFGQEVGRGGGRHGGIGDSLYGVWRLTQCITDESVYTGSV